MREISADLETFLRHSFVGLFPAGMEMYFMFAEEYLSGGIPQK
jgi:hypothetical protein